MLLSSFVSSSELQPELPAAILRVGNSRGGLGNLESSFAPKNLFMRKAVFLKIIITVLFLFRGIVHLYRSALVKHKLSNGHETKSPLCMGPLDPPLPPHLPPHPPPTQPPGLSALSSVANVIVLKLLLVLPSKQNLAFGSTFL